ncbi:MAG: hypothetical protein GY832_05045 [Chloroflexi bacterium]|nr:hypothetical protein [Chloroflexota bacterium]
MPSEVSTLCFGGGEQWGEGEDHHPQTSNHHDNKANPAAALISPLVVTDTAPAQENKPTHPLARPGGDGEGAD